MTRLKLLADENIDSRIIDGLLRRVPDLDIVRVQDVGLRTQDDPTILAWAAEEDRLLMTHDVSTMTDFANQRVARREKMPGIIEIKTNPPIGSTVEDILTIVECSFEGEHEGQTIYLPLK
jgi:predicted nuclease of predicted toxin-antitoxin system